MDRFPLFQLPFVAVLEVMKSFHLFDLTKLSMCSQKIHRWIKRFRVIRRESLFIEVAHLDRLSVEVINDPGEEYLTFDIKSLPSTTHSVNFGGPRIPISLENTDFQYYMHLDFDDKTEGLKTISEYLCTFFEKDITTLFLSSLPCEPIMEWVSKRQGKCRDLMIDDIKYLNYGERVMLESIPEDPQTHFEFDGQMLDVQNAQFFTLNNLLNMNCSELFLRDSRLTNLEMNVFLRHWLSKELKFKRVEIDMEVMRLDVLFFGIPAFRRTNDVMRVFVDIENRPFHVFGGIDIRRNDGKTATIIHSGDQFERRTEFYMIVWDN